MTRLGGVRLIADDRLENRNSFQKFTLPEVNQADVQPNPRHLGHQMFRRAQRFQSFSPLLAPHVHDAQICISSAQLRIDGDHSPEVALGFVQPILAERFLARMKNLRRIGGRARSALEAVFGGLLAAGRDETCIVRATATPPIMMQASNPN